MRDRVRRVFAHVPEGVDVVVLHNNVDPHIDQSFFYATDLVSGGGFERSIALLRRDGKLDVLVPQLEEASARRAPEAEVHVYRKADERRTWLADQVGTADRIGFNAGELVVTDHASIKDALPKTTLVDVSQAMNKARAVKDRVEIDRIRTAGRIVSEVADLLPSKFADGLKEYELAAEISYEMQKRGASGPSFDTIVAFGEGSAEPHYHPHAVPMERSQFVLCDFGARYQRYASDLTRTWIRAPATQELRDIYDTVLRAQEAALAAIRPGVKGGDVHNAAAAVIDGSPWKGRFIHSVGHSLGLAVHDGPALHPRMEWTLEENMVVTVEPGIYVPGVGGVRIEDDVVVTRNGCDLLTSARKDDPVVA